MQEPSYLGLDQRQQMMDKVDQMAHMSYYREYDYGPMIGVTHE